MRLREWALLFYASSALSAAHAEITPVEAKRFIEENPKIYDTGAPSEEVLKILKARLPKQGFAAAVDDVAKSWSIGREAADNVATAVVRMELYLGKEELQAASKRKSSHRLLLQAIDLTPQSEKVWGLLREELDERDNCHREKLADRYFARPGAGAEFLRNEDRYCATWLFDYAKRAPMTSLAYWRLAGLFQSEHEEYRIAAFENILSKFRQRDPESSEAVCLTRMYWMSLASIGLGDWVIKDAEKLSESVKHKILVGESPKEIIIEGATIRTELDCSATTNVRDAWLTSLLDTGRRDEARQWIDRLNIVRPTKKPTKDSKERQSVFDTVDDDTNEFLYRSAFPVNDDIFDLFVGDGERGLLWSVGYRTPLVQHLMIKLFDDAGYATVARDLRERLCDTSTPRSLTESLESRLSYLPKEFLAASSKIASAVQQSRIDGTHCVDASAVTILHDNRRVYKELPLSAEQRSPHGKGDFDASIKVPGLESWNIVRVDRSGAEWAAISLSNLVDPTGEVGLGGYWLDLSSDKGRRWKQPIYTGLMYMEPYIVPSKSKLPLLHGRTLQLEVVVRELDENSITFPPVALTTKREREGVYIELLLEDLMRDSDGDGLTDLLEDKLRTDPNNPDTDGDGLDDGIDPLPQVSVKAAPHRNAEVISMALQRVLGFDRAAIKIGAPPSNDKSSAIESMFGALHRGGGDRNVLFLKADPELFNGLMLPARVIIVNDHDIEQLRARYGVFYPLQFSPWFNRNGDKAVLRWSAGWVGGTLLFTKGNDGWECKEVSNWIT